MHTHNMNIRAIKREDLDTIRELHSKYFSEESNFPDFLDFLCAYVVEDEKGIITAGGIRDIPEVVAVTNKARNPVDRVDALRKILDASVYFSRQFDYEQLYVFSQDPKYTRRILRNGFRLHSGQALIMDL